MTESVTLELQSVTSELRKGGVALKQRIIENHEKPIPKGRLLVYIGGLQFEYYVVKVVSIAARHKMYAVVYLL